MVEEDTGSPPGTWIYQTKQQLNYGLDTIGIQGGGGSVRN